MDGIREAYVDGVCGRGEEAREETAAGGGHAGLGEFAGHDAVVLGVEAELNHVARAGLDLVGRKVQARLANGDEDGGRGRLGDQAREEHEAVGADGKHVGSGGISGAQLSGSRRKQACEVGR